MSNDKSTANPGPGKAEQTPADTDKDRPCKVVSLDEWKNRARGAKAAPLVRDELCPEQIPFLARAQKEAFLLKFILADETTGAELDELLMSAVHCAERKLSP